MSTQPKQTKNIAVKEGVEKDLLKRSRVADSIVQIRPMFLARPDAAAFLSISPSLLDAMTARGTLPRPRRLSAGRSGWLVTELEEWGRNQPISDLLPVINSGYGRAGKPKKN